MWYDGVMMSMAMSYTERAAKDLVVGDRILHRYYNTDGMYSEMLVTVEKIRPFGRYNLKVTIGGRTWTVERDRVFGVEVKP